MGNHIICHHCRSRRSVSPQESRKIRILLVGLDNAGKTTAAKALVGEPVICPAPTLGFSRLELRRRGWTVDLYDVGGGHGIRGIWRNYLAESHGLVFVVDASDAARTDECRETLHGLLGDPRVGGKPVLVLANKQDAPSALDEVELNERLRLEVAANRYRCPTRIELCSARLAGTAAGKKRHLGVQTGFNWLADYVIDNSASLEERVTADLAVRAVELEQQRWARDERIRRSREAAAAAAAASGAGGGDGGGARETPGRPGTTAAAEDPGRSTISPDVTAPAPASARTPRPVSSADATPAPAETLPSPPAVHTPSPDTPLQPELEAQIQEVFTRTEMGRLVRREAAEGVTARRTGAGATEEAGAGAAGIVADMERSDRAGSDSSAGNSGLGGGGGAGAAADDHTVLVHSAAVGDRPAGTESPDSPVMEKDSGQGSIKESDSETLMSSNASQLSAQANGVVPPKRRNRFFKRYTKTSPMPNDVLLTSLPSTPPTRTE